MQRGPYECFLREIILKGFFLGKSVPPHLGSLKSTTTLALTVVVVD